MKFLFISRYGDGAGIAWRLKQEGNNVALWIKQPSAKRAYEGVLPKVDKWETFLDRSTVVVFDSTGGGRTAERLRQQGHPVFGSSVFADELELDRQFGTQLMVDAGIKVPETHTFKSLSEGQSFAKQHKDRTWIFKPSGQMPAELTYVPYDAEDAVEYFNYLKKLLQNESVEFELQELKEGVAVSTEAWCDGTRFVPPFNHTIEKKRFMNDDLGPSTGCVGNVVWAEPRPCRTISEGLARAERTLVGAGYIGPIDLNTIVNEEGVWGLEWTPRFGYDAICCFLRLYKGDFGALISNFARSQFGEAELPLSNVFSGGVRLTIPPAPDEQHPSKGGESLRGFPKEDMPSYYFYEVMLDKDKSMIHSGGFGTVICATGVAATFRESLTRPYEIVERAMVPNKQYRTDLREAMGKTYDEFLKLGG
jgi:phosphoribosylamine--glycine ligase